MINWSVWIFVQILIDHFFLFRVFSYATDKTQIRYQFLPLAKVNIMTPEKGKITHYNDL